MPYFSWCVNIFLIKILFFILQKFNFISVFASRYSLQNEVVMLAVTVWKLNTFIMIVEIHKVYCENVSTINLKTIIHTYFWYTRRRSFMVYLVKKMILGLVRLRLSVNASVRNNCLSSKIQYFFVLVKQITIKSGLFKLW